MGVARYPWCVTTTARCCDASVAGLRIIPISACGRWAKGDLGVTDPTAAHGIEDCQLIPGPLNWATVIVSAKATASTMRSRLRQRYLPATCGTTWRPVPRPLTAIFFREATMRSTIRAVAQAVVLLGGAAWLPPRSAAATNTLEGCPKPTEGCFSRCDPGTPPGCTLVGCADSIIQNPDGSCSYGLYCNYNC